MTYPMARTTKGVTRCTYNYSRPHDPRLSANPICLKRPNNPCPSIDVQARYVMFVSASVLPKVHLWSLVDDII